MNDLQRTDEWKESRLGKITASRFVDIMSKAKVAGTLSTTAKSYLNELVAEALTGECYEFSNIATEHGTEYESEAMLQYEEKLLEEIISVGFIPYSGEDKLLKQYVGGSPDGLVGIQGIIEVKCPYKTVNHLETLYSSKIPVKYYAQVQGNLWITNRKWCDFISYDPRIKNEDHKLLIIRVDRDDDYIEIMSEKIKLFAIELDKLIKQYS